MSIYGATVPQLTKMLRNLEGWLDKGVAHATAKKVDPRVLLNARLAPDQYRFLQQVQTACDTAKLAVARLTGKEAPKHPDTEETVEEVKARIASVIAGSRRRRSWTSPTPPTVRSGCRSFPGVRSSSAGTI